MIFFAFTFSRRHAVTTWRDSFRKSAKKNRWGERVFSERHDFPLGWFGGFNLNTMQLSPAPGRIVF
jgi:hypothetical protein